MLEKLDLEQSLPKDAYTQSLPALQHRLYDLEHAAYTAQVASVVIFEGWAASGKGSTINLLTEKLDPRGFRVVPISPPRTSETRYPWLWRFWLKVPAAGQMVIFDQSWYRRVLADRIAGDIGKRQREAAFDDIREFEQTLAADGTLIVKIWLHISRKEQRRRFKKLLRDPLTAWQVSPEDARQHKRYADYHDAAEEMLARTDATHAPWVLIPATDRRYTRLTVLRSLIQAFESRLGPQAPPAAPPTPAHA